MQMHFPANLHNAVNWSALDVGLKKTYSIALQRVTDHGASIPSETPIKFPPPPRVPKNAAGVVLYFSHPLQKMYLYLYKNRRGVKT